MGPPRRGAWIRIDIFSDSHASESTFNCHLNSFLDILVGLLTWHREIIPREQQCSFWQSYGPCGHPGPQYGPVCFLHIILSAPFLRRKLRKAPKPASHIKPPARMSEPPERTPILT